MNKTDSKTNVSEWANNNVLTVAIAVIVLVITMMFFWDRQQQRTVEMRRIEAKIDILEEWGGGSYSSKITRMFRATAAESSKSFCGPVKYHS